MEIRMLNQEEILGALHFVWEVYTEQEIPYRDSMEVITFQEYIKYPEIMRAYEERTLHLFGALEQNELVGVGAVSSTGYIRLLYAKSGSFTEDIKKQLLQFLKQYGASVLRIHTLKAEADERTERFYCQNGFVQFGRIYNQNGKFVKPFEIVTRQADPEFMARQSRNSTAIGIILVVLVLSFLLFFAAGIVLYSTRTAFSDRSSGTQKENRFEDFFREPYEEEVPEGDGYDALLEETGIEAIRSYKAEDLKYTVEEKSFTESQYERNHIIDFQIAYPQLVNLSGEQAERINKNIELAAMQTANEWYYKADEKKKEEMLWMKNPCLVSFVDYNTSYMSNSFASILFEDKSYKGDYSTSYIELRAQNINLATGENYQVKDIVTLNKAFMERWYEIMNQEAPNAAALLGVTMEEFQKILEGTLVTANDTSYAPSFFVFDGGMEIGFHYKAETGDSGWITAPFTFEEARKFKTDSSFWTLF